MFLPDYSPQNPAVSLKAKAHHLYFTNRKLNPLNGVLQIYLIVTAPVSSLQDS